MIYDFFCNYVMGDSEAAAELLADSVTLQKALAACGMVTAIATVLILCYAVVVLVRGWK